MSGNVTNELPVTASLTGDFQSQLLSLDGAPAVTFAFDVQLAEVGHINPAPVIWDPAGFSLFVSDDVIRASVKTSDGTIVRFRAANNTFSDLALHHAELTIDTERNVFRVSIDNQTIFERVDLDLVLPPTFAETQIGDARGWGGTAVEIANAAATVAKALDGVVSTLQHDGRIDLDFNQTEPMVGLLLHGDAAVAGGVLTLDGTGDYAVLTEKYSLADASYLSVELDFKYTDANDTGGAYLIWNHGAFGVHVRDNGINVMVVDGKGQKDFIWRGGVDFTDLDWHHLSLTIDPENGVLTTSIDGDLLIDETGLSLSLPSTSRSTTIGSDSWGGNLNGQIDNVVLSTERPQEVALDPVIDDPLADENWDAVGLADPGLATNTIGYTKWAESTAATFIDRMKGALAWSGKQEVLYNDSGEYHILRDAEVFNNPGLIEDITFSNETIININYLIVSSRWNKGLIDADRYAEILANPYDYFKIAAGASGNSELLGRLDVSDPFTVVAQFDQDIGMSLEELRAAKQAWIKPSDITVAYSNLVLDENGWPIELPTNVAGGVGEVSSIIMWYPELAAEQPDNIYSGTFYLMAEGEGMVDLVQSGGSADRINIKGIKIDGPTMVPFEYNPDGQRVTLTITSSDPDGTGEYVRNIQVVHESHMELFAAGEIFTPEFVELHQDDRAVRWMAAQDAARDIPQAEGSFEDAQTKDYYTFNMGTNGTPRNGVPVDAIIEFANKTGSDPWISVPINASDDFVWGMAEYIEANLDPRLMLHLEFANENWNSVFPTYQISKAEGIERWGMLELETDSQGKFVRDANGDLVILNDGYFFSPTIASQNGFKNLVGLRDELGLSHNLISEHQAWAEWSSMRATQVAAIFEDVYSTADAANADARLDNVMATYTGNIKATDYLMRANVWHQAEPGNWIDPASVFDSLAVAGYIGGTAGNKHSDMVRYWIDEYGEAKAAELLVRQLKADVDPALNYIAIKSKDIGSGNVVKASGHHTGVEYTPDLIVDVYDAIFGKNSAIRNSIQSAEGMKGVEVLVGSVVKDYVRLDTNADGNSILQLRVNPAAGDFETIVEFDSYLPVTIDQMLEDGTLFVRSIPSIGEAAQAAFVNQKAKADAYGLDFVAYEGGQHLAAATWGAYRANLADATLTDFLSDLNTSPEIGEVYTLWLQAWEDAGGGLFAHYADYGLSSRYGSWGTLEYLGQENDPTAETYRYDVLQELNQQSAWWDEGREPGTFLQGITNTGTPGNDLLRGTSEEDVLLGGDGDDEILGGPGDDALGGGSGMNIIDAGYGDDLILVASMADQIEGGDGTDIVRLASTVATFDLADLNAAGVEILDTRNHAETEITMSTADVFAFTPSHSLILYMDTADSLELSGFSYNNSVPEGAGELHIYEGLEGTDVVTLTVITNIPGVPDALLMA